MKTTDPPHKLNACDPSLDRVAAQPNRYAEALWRGCLDGSWLLWLVAELHVDFPGSKKPWT
jgi:hypothetical protein